MNSIVNKFLEKKTIFKTDKLGAIGLIIIISYIIIGIFAPHIAPYDPNTINYRTDGSIARMDPPSSKHLSGTTRLGRDIFSQLVMGSRVALIVGFLSSIIVVFIGTTIGLISGYCGKKVDEILMFITDITYGIPFLPFIIVLVSILGPNIKNIIIAICIITWRTTARVIRSQVLVLKEMPFIEAARLSGASDFRIIIKHIVPNVLPLSFVYIALSMGWSIMTEASVSFLGYGDPTLESWGKILYMVRVSQAARIAWWWILPPGFAIILLVISTFFVTRSYEEILNPSLTEGKR